VAVNGRKWVRWLPVDWFNAFFVRVVDCFDLAVTFHRCVLMQVFYTSRNCRGFKLFNNFSKWLEKNCQSHISPSFHFAAINQPAAHSCPLLSKDIFTKIPMTMFYRDFSRISIVKIVIYRKSSEDIWRHLIDTSKLLCFSFRLWRAFFSTKCKIVDKRLSFKIQALSIEQFTANQNL